MTTTNQNYFFYLLLVCLVFFLFTIIISILGYIIFYSLRKIHNKDWNLNNYEKAIVCYSIGLSVYISFSFILDLFKFFNSISAYYSVIVTDGIFILFLIYRRELNKEKVFNLYDRINKNFKLMNRKTIFSIIILISVIFIQIWIQWNIMTERYALTSKDTYVWLGQSWYLIENGYIWREHMPLHYPKGYTFYLTGPILIYPNWRFAYYYMKFAGIPFFSFYIFVLYILLKRIFGQNYMILIGLSLTLLSNLLFLRFISFVSSSIPSLLILISLIILRSKCPFYFVGFIISLIFLFNALFALIYMLSLILLLIIKLISKEKNIRNFLIYDLGLTIIVVVLLFLPYIIHVIIVQNISFIDLIIAFFVEFGYPETKLSKSISISSSHYFIIQVRYILKNYFPNNDIIFGFLDLERKILSYFLIFDILIMFLPTKKYFNHKFKDLINFGKSSLIVIILFYVLWIFFEDSSNVFLQNTSWFSTRAVEGLAGPVIILTCFFIDLIIEKSKILSIYLKNKNKRYRNLINNHYFSDFLKFENVIISLILISIFSSFLTNKRIYYTYYYEKDQVDAIFYVKENIPSNSKLLVSDFGDTTNAFYDLLSTYDYKLWDFSFEDNIFNETIDYIYKKDIEFILLDHTLINSTEYTYFRTYHHFDKLYKNDYYIIFEIED